MSRCSVMRFGRPGNTFVHCLKVCFLGLCVILPKTVLMTAIIGHQESVSSADVDADILQPYLLHHGPVHRRLRDTQQCQHVRYGNQTYSMHPVHKNLSAPGHIVDIHHKIAVLDQSYYTYHQQPVSLRFQRVYNPLQTFSILEPKHPNTCGQEKNERATVRETAATRECVVAANAGFFNTHTGACLGNIVCDGKLVQNSGGIQNVHFGITKNGQIFTGYLSEIELITHDFQQLVGGVIWLIRDGDIYVDESKRIECPDTEETGTLDRFINVVSARTAVGHDSAGHILMVQLNGKTDLTGANLREFAALLKELGFVNAINLDGGGSATSVISGTLVNYPSDTCDNKLWNCERKVSTILCVHAIQCSPPDCSGHGECRAGQCQCHSHWSGAACDTLTCPAQCGGHGQCQEDGCHCDAGWSGADCSSRCSENMYGTNCSARCQCMNGGACDPVSGRCRCLPGYTGRFCESVCPYNLYGQGCRHECQCPGTCWCDHITGVCNQSTLPSHYRQAGECLIQSRMKKDNLVPDQTPQIKGWTWATASLTVVLMLSFALNVWLGVVLLKIRSKTRQTSSSRHPRPRRARQLSNKSPHLPAEKFPLYAVEKSRRDSTNSSDEVDEETALVEKKDVHADQT